MALAKDEKTTSFFFFLWGLKARDRFIFYFSLFNGVAKTDRHSPGQIRRQPTPNSCAFCFSLCEEAISYPKTDEHTIPIKILHSSSSNFSKGGNEMNDSNGFRRWRAFFRSEKHNKELVWHHRNDKWSKPMASNQALPKDIRKGVAFYAKWGQLVSFFLILFSCWSRVAKGGVGMKLAPCSLNVRQVTKQKKKGLSKTSCPAPPCYEKRIEKTGQKKPYNPFVVVVVLFSFLNVEGCRWSWFLMGVFGRKWASNFSPLLLPLITVILPVIQVTIA